MSHVEAYTELLVEILAREDFDANDFVSLAMTGEDLRRALVLEESPPGPSVEAVKRYDEALGELSEFAPDGLEVELEKGFKDLQAYGRRPIGERDPEEGDDLIRGMDGVLYVAAASARAGRIPDENVITLGREARKRALEVAPALADLWDLAEERYVSLGPDGRFPGLYDWIEALAELSMLRDRVIETVSLAPAAERAWAIGAAVRRLTRSEHPPVPAPSLANVIHVSFERPVSRVQLREVADGTSQTADPAGDGAVIDRKQGEYEIRTAEVPSWVPDDPGGLTCLRVELFSERGEPLDGKDAVLVRDSAGMRVVPLRDILRRRLYWAILPGPGPFRLQVHRLKLDVTIHVERPDREEAD